MNIDEYLLHYDNFHAEFCPKAGTVEKQFKLVQECREFVLSYLDREPVERSIDEATDVMNTAIAYLRSEGVINPLWAGYLKLEKTAEKYRRQANGSSNL